MPGSFAFLVAVEKFLILVHDQHQPGQHGQLRPGVLQRRVILEAGDLVPPEYSVAPLHLLRQVGEQAARELRRGVEREHFRVRQPADTPGTPTPSLPSTR